MVIKYFNIKDMATLNGLNQSLQDTIEKVLHLLHELSLTKVSLK